MKNEPVKKAPTTPMINQRGEGTQHPKNAKPKLPNGGRPGILVPAKGK